MHVHSPFPLAGSGFPENSHLSTLTRCIFPLASNSSLQCMWVNKLRQHAAQDTQQEREAETVQLAGWRGKKHFYSTKTEIQILSPSLLCSIVLTWITTFCRHPVAKLFNYTYLPNVILFYLYQIERTRLQFGYESAKGAKKLNTQYTCISSIWILCVKTFLTYKRVDFI